MSDKTINQEELNHLLDEHEKWLNDRSKGKCFEISNANLQNLDLSARNLTNAVLNNVDFSNSNFEKTSFYGNDTILKNISFCRANLSFSEFTDAKLENVNFSDANLKEASLMSFFVAKNIKFDNANLYKAKFIKSSMDFVSFRNALLIEANFRRAHIDDSSFENADCSRTDFTFVSLYRCQVEGAIIEGANFEDARNLPEEWKQKIGWYSEEAELKRRIKRHLKENP